MLKKVFCVLVLFSLSESYWLPFLKSSRQLEEENLLNEGNNETEEFETLSENNFTTVKSTDLFWTAPDTYNSTELPEYDGTEQDEITGTELIQNEMFENSTISDKNDSNITELISPVEADELNVEETNADIKIPTSDSINSQMDEEIMLSRANCNMEIGVDETRDTRILVKFGPILNSNSGKCCITLNGEKGSVLGVFISDIHLLNNSSKEVLKVIINNFGAEFVLKEYYSRSEYQPLLLTETHKVYLVLYYNGTRGIKNEDISRFNLEVFSYQKHNHLKQRPSHQNYYSSSGINNIYFTTEDTLFANDQYFFSVYFHLIVYDFSLPCTGCRAGFCVYTHLSLYIVLYYFVFKYDFRITPSI